MTPRMHAYRKWLRSAGQDTPVPKVFMAGWAAAQREWVGLTEEDRMDVCEDCGCLGVDWLELVAAVEAKLKEKNT